MARNRATAALALLTACASPGYFQVDRAAVIAAADLHYKGPPPRSEAGLPIGNGRVGSLVWTEPDRLRMQVNRVDVFARNASVTEGEEADWAGGCGTISVLPGEGAGFGPETTLHLSAYEALARVEGQGVRARTFAWPARDVLVLEVEDLRPEPRSIALELGMLRAPLVRDRDLVARSTLRSKGGRVLLEQDFEALQHRCRSVVAVEAAGVPAKVEEVSGTHWRLVAAPARRVTFLIGSAAALDGVQDLQAEAAGHLDAAAALGLEELLAEHRAHWQDFWSRSIVAASSPGGEADMVAEYWAWTLYVMGSTSRGAFPPKFNGMLWSTDGDTRRWGSQFWWWNTQILYRPLEAANHPELMEPLFDLYGGVLEGGRTAARQQWGAEGIYIGETSDYDGLEELPPKIAEELRELLLGRLPYGDTSEAFRAHALARNGYNARWNWTHKLSTAPFSWVTHIIFSGAQVAWHHWLHYQYTLDEGFLRERAYPLLRGVAEFYRTFPNLVLEEDGLYHLHLLNDQELLWGTRDPHNELWAARGILNTALEASRILGVDEGLRPGWEELLERLAPAPLSTDPDVVPGSWYAHPSGRPVWALGRLPVRKVEALSSDTIVRPCVDYDLWSLESRDGELTRLALDSYEADPMRLSALTEGHGYALSELPLVAAALGQTEDLRKVLPDHLRRGLLPNRLSLEDGEQAQTIEPIATAATATQWALLQSKPPAPGEPPVIRVFPAWPREWDVTFELAARRGVLVRSSMRSGDVEYVELESRLGGEVRLRSPWGSEPVTLRRGGGGAARVRGPLLQLTTEPGEVLRLVP